MRPRSRGPKIANPGSGSGSTGGRRLKTPTRIPGDFLGLRKSADSEIMCTDTFFRSLSAILGAKHSEIPCTGTFFRYGIETGPAAPGPVAPTGDSDGRLRSRTRRCDREAGRSRAGTGGFPHGKRRWAYAPVGRSTKRACRVVRTPYTPMRPPEGPGACNRQPGLRGWCG